MSESEHRDSPRVSRSFLVRYRGAAEGQKGWLAAPLRDFSDHGAHFISERSFIVGDEVELQLTLPSAPSALTLKATVAWTKLAKFGLVEIGWTFQPGDDGSQQMLRQAVARFLQGRRIA